MTQGIFARCRRLASRNLPRFFIRLTKKSARQGATPPFKLATLNGAPGFLLYLDGALDQTLSIETDGEEISAVYLVRNPEKLKSIAECC